MPANIGHMFYFGEIPWHGLGTKLDHAATADEAIAAGQLNWTVEKAPLATADGTPIPVIRRVAVVRTDLRKDNPKRVLGVVYPEFTPLQNVDGVRVFDSLLGRGNRVYHTGGWLGNGEVVWLMAKLPQTITVAGNDVLEPYMLYSNSHDGSHAIDFRLTTVRVVCQNTLALALDTGNSSHIFRRAHHLRPEELQAEAERFFALCEKSVLAASEEFRALHVFAFTQTQFENYVERVLPLPTPPRGLKESETLQKAFETRTNNVKADRALVARIHAEGWRNGVTILPEEPTLWGALNAVTAFVDHAQKIKGHRYAHIHFGAGAALKARARTLALALLM